MKIFCTNYCPLTAEQPGNQPIRVFYPYYSNIYENIKSELLKEYPNVGLESNKFEFYANNIAMESPACSTAKISVHDTFMSFLWSYTYGILLLTPSKGKELSIEDRSKCKKLIEYSLSLITKYSEWDKETLPNPELYENDRFQYIGKTNNMFFMGVNYIFYHEFAHLVLGHIAEININAKAGKSTPLDRRKEMEFEADNFAAERIMNLIHKEVDRDVAKFAINLTLSALVFTSSNFYGGKFHPDPDHRVKSYLENLKIQENDINWGVAAFAMLQWQLYYNERFKLPQAYKSQMQYFYDVLEGVDSFKKSQQ